ncbi:4Fe-4S binding protein [Nonomuraea wenchangensis]
MLRKSVTQQYPEVKPALPPRSRGVIALVEENCTSCMLCARECPDWCIYIDSHKETVPAPEGGRPRQRNVLDRFAIDFALCMYCGICIEVCPFDALFWSPEFEYAEGDIRNLLHEKDRLSTWTQTVPPPPSHDPGAEPPKELTAAPRRPAGRATPGTSAPADRPARGPRDAKTAQAPAPTATPAPAPATPPPTAAAEAPSGGPRTDATPPQQPATSTGSTGKGTPGAGTTAADMGTGGTGTGGTGTGGTGDAGAGGKGVGGTGTAGVGGPQPPAAAQPPTAAPASGAEPGRQGQEAEPGTPGRPQRPRRAMSNVRGIRPPGTLPARPADDTPAPQAGDEESQGASQPTGGSSSTGGPAEEELSTGSGETRSKPDSQEQTAAPSPRRRRMADPRSIRPPGRLGPDEPKEPEEES